MRSLLLALAFVVGFSAAAMAEEECRLVKVASLPITEDQYGRPQVPVRINGTERKFLVNTASPFSALGGVVARELGLHPQEIRSHEIYSSSGKMAMRMVTVETMAFGISEAKYPHLMLLDMDDVFDGILGTDYLSNFDLDFDFSTKTLNLFSPDHCKGKAVYWTLDYVEVPFKINRSDNIILPVVLDGKELLAVINTGATDTFLSMQTARYEFDLKEGAADLEPLPDANEKSNVRFRRRFGALSIQGVMVKNPLIYLQKDAADRAFRRKHDDKTQADPLTRVDLERQDLTVGMSILSKLHLYIAYKEKMLYVSGANAH